MDKQVISNKKPQKPYSEMSGLWISLSVTAAAAVLNIIFISVILANKASFMLYSGSPKLGTNSNLMDPHEAALRTSIEVTIGILATILVALLTFLKRRNLIRLVVILQVIFTGIAVAQYTYSVVYMYVSNQLISLVASIVIALVAVGIVVWYMTAINPSNAIHPKKVSRK